MSSYPPLLDFIIDLNESNPKDYWNYYAFNSSIINSLDFDYLKILKNQGFLTEILLKEQHSIPQDSIMFLSVTQERMPFFEKSKKRKIHKKIEMLKPLRKELEIQDNDQVKTPINYKIIRKKSKYLKNQRRNFNDKRYVYQPKPNIHKIVIKIEDTGDQNQLTNKALNNLRNSNIFKKKHSVFKKHHKDKQNGFFLQNDKESDFLPQNQSPNYVVQERESVPFIPSFENFINFLQSTIPLQPHNSILSEEDLESLYLLRAMVDLHKQPERKSNLEKSKAIIKNLPVVPQEPHFLPVLNQALDIDYTFMHLNIEAEGVGFRPAIRNLKRNVVYNEEKSLNSLSNYFKMPMEDLIYLFNSVSRHFPDLMEVFKGNNRLIWNEDEDMLLKTGQCLGKDRKRMLRRIRYLSSIDSNFLK